MLFATMRLVSPLAFNNTRSYFVWWLQLIVGPFFLLSWVNLKIFFTQLLTAPVLIGRLINANHHLVALRISEYLNLNPVVLFIHMTFWCLFYILVSWCLIMNLLRNLLLYLKLLELNMLKLVVANFIFSWIFHS